MKAKALIIAALLLLSGHFSNIWAQKVALSTNLLDWTNLGTANMEASLSVSQHLSFVVGGHYNPWSYQTPKGYDVINQQTTGYIGMRYWPWYVYSGWWFEAIARYSSFRKAGLWRPALEESQSVGGGLTFGYTIMLHEHLNIEFGAGIWGGRHFDYSLYECPRCMELRERSPRNFIAPEDISISIMYIF
ncbi:MAG: DUF3575 domain-containing protein [Bacteroidales bacterium]|nr:DUF3575 domain-containing protein [Bacteroidales bacterium]